MLSFLKAFSIYGEMEFILTVILLSYIIPIILGIFYLITLQNTLRSIDAKHRSMEPENVWFTLIPVFNFIWIFIVVFRIAESIKNELNARGRMIQGKPTYAIGLVSCILSVVSRIPFGGDMPLDNDYLLMGVLLFIGFLVCWIIHWVKVNEYKKQFLSEPYEPIRDSQIFGHV